MEVDFTAPEDFDAEVHGADFGQVLLTLLETNQSRYELQARKFLLKHRLVVKAKNALLLYDFEDGLVWSQISFSDGMEWERFTGTGLDDSEQLNISRLKGAFAHSEAQLLLAY